jgi:dUTP pyrophosphatase
MRLDSQYELDYRTMGSAGFDLRSCAGSDIMLQPGDRKMIPAGIKIIESEPNEYLAIVPKSGIAVRYGVTVLNSPGIVDGDYPLEINVILINHSDVPFLIKDGDQIAQGIVCKYENLVGSFRNSQPRTGGFGSTGG